MRSAQADPSLREEAMERTAACHCGQLRVTTTGEPERVGICHCQACQRRTGSLFHAGAYFTKEQVRSAGEYKTYERDSDSGFKIRFHFCPVCGSSVFWDGDRIPELCGVAVGAFADPNFPPPKYSIWEESRHAWLNVPDIERFAQGRPPART